MTEEEINQFFLDNRTKSADTNLSDVYDDSANAPTFYGSTLPVNKVAQNLQSNSRLEPYNPSLTDYFKSGASYVGEKVGMNNYQANKFGRQMFGDRGSDQFSKQIGFADIVPAFRGMHMAALPMIPAYANEAYRAFDRGDYVGGAMEGGAALLESYVLGKPIAKSLKTLAKSISSKLNGETNIVPTKEDMKELGALPSNKVLANTKRMPPSMAMVNTKLSLDDIKNKYSNVDLDVYNDPKGLTLSKIVVSEGVRSEGIGSNVMNDLIKYADENNKPIALTPDNSFGGSKTRLESFYKKFGFKENKGRNKDFAFRETMIRQPKVSQEKRQLILDNRRKEANIARFGYDPNETVDTSYRMQHTPNPEGARLDDMTGGGEYFPDDIYSSNGLKFYGDPNNKFDRESFDVIQSVKGNPEAEVTIYRAVPNEDNINTINSGDFVTLSKEYADMHGASGYGIDGQEAGKIISQKVKVKHLRSDGNDLNEFGYFPENKGDVAKAIPPTEKSDGIFAFHGSASDFDEFKLSKIGTGEGAQVFGNGLYFTDSKDIAKFYKDSVRGFKDLGGRTDWKYKDKSFDIHPDDAQNLEEKGVALLVQEIRLTSRYPDKAKETLIKKHEKEIKRLKRLTKGMRERGYYPGMPNDILDLGADVELEELLVGSLQREIDAIKKVNLSDIKQSKGSVYEVKIDAIMNDLLDYDKPLSFQKEILDKIEKTHGDPEIIATQLGLDFKKASGGEFLTALEGLGASNKKNASQWLTKSDIKGIKYDAGKISGKESDATNYVIFDDKIISIMKKYGIVGAIGVSAMENSNDQSIGALGSLPNDGT